MLVECVPNVSEGRRPDVLAAIRDQASAAGVRVLGVSADPDHHRAVLTLVGEGERMLEAAFAVAAEAVRRIDLRHHRGVHPRFGAVDVIPFVPLAGTPMAYCVELARRLGARLGAELELPVFLYEQAATRPERRNLADVRRGQFEGLAARLAGGDVPDFGPSSPHPSAGAVAVGARGPLVAFNAMLGTADVAIARAVARAVRASGGGLAGVKALGLALPSRGTVQVSMNLVHPERTTLWRALELVRREAARYGVAVTGTEIVGFVPLGALAAAAREFLQAHGFGPGDVLEQAYWGAPLTGAGPDPDA
ncbi:MAG: glutamate formimidoyltransferase [Actinomycetia bacterium]|nr:glutamate formimidoyltransferase [Actinomycetes bacterium]